MLPRDNLILEFWDRKKELGIKNKEYAKFANDLIGILLKHDINKGDTTSNSLIKNKEITAVIIAKEKGIVAGLEEFSLINKDLKLKFLKKDGDKIKYGDVLIEISGNANKILERERVSLNLLQRMSGIATNVNKLNKKSTKIKKQLIFGIVQGADFKDLRLRSAKELVAMNFDGYAIGGLAVGETAKVMYQVLDYTVDQLPENKARYLMGVGYPENIIEAVKRGIDMFDCVIPTREARHGKLYIWRTQPNVSKKNFYTTININNAKFRKDKTPINNTTLKNYSRAYLHHLFKTGEPLSLKLATLNNLEFYLTLMAQIRQAIRANKL